MFEEKFINDIDVTEVIDSTMPKTWECPHCGKRNITGSEADEILPLLGKYIEQCPHCGYLHLFRLILTDEFKKNVVDFLKNYPLIKNAEKASK